VVVASAIMEAAEEAMRRVEALTATVEIGRVYTGRVTSIKDFGAFVEILPGKDGLVHISELADGYVQSVTDVCKVGDEMTVKVIAVDDQDRVKLSRKALLRDQQGGEEGSGGGGDGGEQRRGGERDRDRDRGDRGERRGDRDRDRGERRGNGGRGR
jgi:polyribonucleotide nucleotidyltransferase